MMNNDHQLKTDVQAELAWEPSITADHIGVTAKDGVVTLTGHVDNFWQKQAAETATGRVKGVKGIAEEIEVRLPLHLKLGDDEIATSALNRMKWAVSIPKDAVKVKVEKGHITLTGTVDQCYQKDAAEFDIRPLTGVTGVTNKIIVKAHPDSMTISEDIRHALHRSWMFDENIKVSSTGGKVHLTGNVENWHDRELAAATAWAAPGTTSVSNDILVD
jgi:osmotically-inducible protein OsmY